MIGCDRRKNELSLRLTVGMVSGLEGWEKIESRMNMNCLMKWREVNFDLIVVEKVI